MHNSYHFSKLPADIEKSGRSRGDDPKLDEAERMQRTPQEGLADPNFLSLIYYMIMHSSMDCMEDMTHMGSIEKGRGVSAWWVWVEAPMTIFGMALLVTKDVIILITSILVIREEGLKGGGAYHDFMLTGAVVHLFIAPIDIADLVTNLYLEKEDRLDCPTLQEFLHFYPERIKADNLALRKAFKEAFSCIPGMRCLLDCFCWPCEDNEQTLEAENEMSEVYADDARRHHIKDVGDIGGHVTDRYHYAYNEYLS